MSPSDISLPVSVEVSIGEVAQGIFEIEGDLSFTDETLTFAYRAGYKRSQDAPLETLDIPLDALREAVLKRKVKGVKIVLRPSRLDILEPMPGANPDAFVFEVKAAHRQQAAALVSQLQRRLPSREEAPLPFRLPDLNLGFTEVTGLLYLDEAFLVFEVATGLSGGTQRDRQVIKVELPALQEIRLDRGLFTDRLYVRPKKRDLLAAMPGTYEEALKLTLRKKDRAQAEQFVYEIKRLQKSMRSAKSGE